LGAWIEQNMNLWNKIKKWFIALFIDEYEVTIYFPNEIIEKPDGSKQQGFNPKTYVCRKLKKVTNTHFKLCLVDGNFVEIKTVDPVGFDIVKTK